jgi:hypothetical protein
LISSVDITRHSLLITSVLRIPGCESLGPYLTLRAYLTLTVSYPRTTQQMPTFHAALSRVFLA